MRATSAIHAAAFAQSLHQQIMLYMGANKYPPRKHNLEQFAVEAYGNANMVEALYVAADAAFEQALAAKAAEAKSDAK